jgi:hypothetical protein
MLGGCALQRPVPPPSHVTVRTIEPGHYTEAFNAVRDAFRAYGFTLDRVDGRAGVITTQPAPSSELRPVLAGVRDAARRGGEGLMHRHRRVAEARFVVPDSGGEEDLTQWDGALSLRVRVSVERLHRFNTNIEPVSIRLSSVSGRSEQGKQDASIVVSYLRDDEKMASLLLERISRLMPSSGE